MRDAAELVPPANQGWLVLVALFSGVFVLGIAFAGIVPWMSLVLESRGADPTTMGIVAAANPIGVMVMAPFVGWVMQRLGTANSIMIGTGVGALCIIVMPLFEGTTEWIALRFISGLATAVPWVATETWINTVADARSRGRVIAVYTAVLSLGFAAGPLVLSVVGTDGWSAPLVFFALEAAAIIPTFAVRKLSPYLETEARLPVLGAIWAMPAVFAAAFVGGMVDTAFLTFLPIWGLRTGLDHEFALALLSIFIIGNVILPFPVGWLSDRIGIRPVMALCGAISVIGPLLSVYFAASPILLSIVLFVWGGAVFSLYSLAMTDIGHRCRGTSLAAASGALVVVYTISNISGPPLTGAAMQAWGVHSLMAVSAVVAAMFMVILALTVRSVSTKFPP
jgi:MFS family permease